MKVLWIEDHEPVRDMLAVAADKAARARVQVDLVLAHTLMEAERRLRLERFDLVVTEIYANVINIHKTTNGKYDTFFAMISNEPSKK